MGWFRQFGAVLYRNGLIKTRSPFKLMVELVLPFLMLTVCSQLFIKGGTDDIPLSKNQTQYKSARAIPGLAELYEYPLPSESGTGLGGAWYLSNLKEWVDHDGANVAWKCDVDAFRPPPPPNPKAADLQFKPGSGAGRFLQFEGLWGGSQSLCEPLTLAVTVQDGSSAEAAAAAEAFAAALGALPGVGVRVRGPSVFASSAAVDSYVVSGEYGSGPRGRLGAAVVFRSGSSYVLRVNSTTSSAAVGGFSLFGSDDVEPAASNVPDTSLGMVSERTSGETSFSARYLLSGVLSLQTAVDEFIASRALNRTVVFRGVQAPLPAYEAKENAFFKNGGATSLGLFAMIGVIGPVVTLVGAVAEDKESRFRELMFTMGLSPSAWLLSWSSLSYLTSIVNAAMLTMGCVAFGVTVSSSFALVYLFWLGFYWATVSHSMFVVSLFERAGPATVSAMLGVFLAFLIFIALDGPSTPGAVKLVAGLVHPAAGFSFTAAALGERERTLLPVSFRTWGESSAPGALSVRDGVLVLWADFVIYMLLAAYLDSVLPSSMAAARNPWYWPLAYPATLARRARAGAARLTWGAAAQRQEAEEAALAGSIALEPLSPEQLDSRRRGRGIVVRGLEKQYHSAIGTTFAVRGVTVSMLEGEITVLLGSNGAGKSTLSNVITGLVSGSAGELFVNGLDCSKDMSGIRRQLGVCPQVNILVPMLTVEEHLRLFAAIKDVPAGAATSRRVREAIGEVGLFRQTHLEAKYLSGGMKRKLQLAMALLNSKVCVLDEPSSGLDVTARQQIQRTIASYRRGRTIILTTHYMDEADLLGDRVCIMSQGKLACAGSSLFLKSRFGVGYVMTVTQSIAAGRREREDLIQLVSKAVPRATVATDAGAEASFNMPLNAAASFAPMLRQLDALKERLKIATYGISVTNLDSVFLKVCEADHDVAAAAGADEPRPKSLLSRPEAGAPAQGGVVVPVEPGDEPGGQPGAARGLGLPSGTGSSFGAQLRLLLNKRVVLTKRDRRAWLCQLLLPVVFLAVGFGTLTIKATRVRVPLAIGARTAAGPPGSVLVVSAADQAKYAFNLSEAEPLAFGSPAPAPFCQDLATTLEGFFDIDEYLRSGFTTYNTTVKAPEKPLSSAGAAPGAVPDHPFGESGSPELDRLWAAVRAATPSCSAATCGLASLAKCRSLSAKASANDTFAEHLFRSDLALGSLLGGLANGARAGVTVDAVTVEEQRQSVAFQFTARYNFTGVHVMPLLLNRIHSALLSAVALSSAAVEIEAGIELLPDTLLQTQIASGVSTFGATFAIGIAFSFGPSLFAVFVTREKEIKAWHQQVLAGVRSSAYWLSNFLFDGASFLVPVALSLLLILAVRLDSLTSELAGVITVFVLYGLAVIPFTYCLSYLFDTAAAAQFGSLAVLLSGSTVLLLVSSVMSVLPNTYAVNQILERVYRLIPSYSLAHALAQAGNVELVSYLFNLKSRGGDPNNPVKLTFWSLPVAGEDVLFLAGGAVGYSLLLMLLQGVFRSGTARPKFLATWHFSEGVESGIALEDDDVRRERAYVEGLASGALKAATGEDGDLRAVLRKARKVYSDGKVAVQQLSLGFRKNECFGLLGTNGAGKTTAQSMLCGELPPSGGEIYINGKNVLSPSSAALRNLGYCPQFDPIYDLLTAREHLVLYGKIRGVRDLDAEVESLLTELQLTRFADRLAGGFSGGNKRKLSLAMAVIGNPALVLLDEPSAGIDPSARRAVSAFVQKLAKQTSVVLTTHSMEECEALCSRVGIMVDGGMRCLNSVQAIKSRYGQGYQIEVTLRIPTQEELLALARECDLEQQIDQVIVNRDFCKELLAFLGDERLYAAHFVGSDLDLQLKVGTAKLSVRAFVLWLFSARAADRILHMLITKMDPEAKLESREGRRLRFKVPISTKLSVADMFDVVEQGKSKAGIQDFALSQTTLETIFSAFAKTAGLDPAKIKRRNQQRQQEEVPVARALDP